MAVVNYNADFAVANGIELVPGKVKNAAAVLLEYLALLIIK